MFHSDLQRVERDANLRMAGIFRTSLQYDAYTHCIEVVVYKRMVWNVQRAVHETLYPRRMLRVEQTSPLQLAKVVYDCEEELRAAVEASAFNPFKGVT